MCAKRNAGGRFANRSFDLAPPLLDALIWPAPSVPRADDRPPKAAIGQLKADDLITEIDRVHHLIGGIVADRKNDQSILGHVATRLAYIGFGNAPLRITEAVAFDVVFRVFVDQRSVENDEVEILLVDLLEKVGLKSCKIEVVELGVRDRRLNSDRRDVRRHRSRGPIGRHIKRDDAAAAPDLQRLGDQVWVHSLDIADEKFGARIRQRVVDASGNVDHKAIGIDSLWNGLAANQRLMRDLNIEHRGIDQIGDSKLPKHGGAPRANAPLDLEIADIHLASPCI